MKKIKSILYLLVLALFFQACEGIDLNEGIDPINSIPTDGAINNIKSATAAVIGVYDALQANHTDGMLFLAQIYSDEADFTGTFPTRFEFATLNIQTSNGTNAGVFSNFYVVINRANNVIDILPTVEDPGLTPEVTNSFIGEARMARALSYFYLTEYFGDVPLILTPTREVSGDALNVSNARQADIRAQII